jgi:hypothetical protein
MDFQKGGEFSLVKTDSQSDIPIKEIHEKQKNLHSQHILEAPCFEFIKKIAHLQAIGFPSSEQSTKIPINCIMRFESYRPRSYHNWLIY